MAAEEDFCLPEKKSRLDECDMNCISPAATAITDITTSTTITTVTKSSPLHDMSMPQEATDQPSTCLEEVSKDSLIAEILGDSGADFAEPTNTSLCGHAMFFDDTCYQSENNAAPQPFSPQDSCWTTEHDCSNPQQRQPHYQHQHLHHHHSVMMSSAVAKDTHSLLITMETHGGLLQQTIEQVLAEHELLTCCPSEAMALCNEKMFQLIWVHLPSPISQDVLSVVTAIRYSSKCNRKTIMMGVTSNQPEIDLHLHGMDDILLEPVSKATIRQKYFDWTTVKVMPDYELGLKETPLTPATPDSSVSTESTIELNLSSLASDTTNDSGIQAEADIVDLKPPPPFAFPPHSVPHTSQHANVKDTKPRMSMSIQTTSPPNPPSWCRAEHATKEKHRRERIKDSCDQLRVLLPYVRGRKTDMASILEMTVDYLKIVNSKLPTEFHAHVLDLMTKSGGPNACPSVRTPISGGRGSRGGRGRGSRRNSQSPARTLASQGTGTPTENFLCASTQSRITRVLGRPTMSTPVSTITRGGGVSRGCKTSKRGGQTTNMMLSPVRIPSLFLSSDAKDRGGQRCDSGPPSGMSLPTFIQPALHTPSSHMFTADTPSASSAASTLVYSSLGHASTSSSGVDAAGVPPAPRMYGPTHFSVDSFLAHGGIGTPGTVAPPPPPPPSMTARYSLSADRREGGGGGGGVSSQPLPASAIYSDPSAPSYYHYHFPTAMADLTSAYTVASCTGGGAQLCNDFLASGSTLVPSANSAFTPRGQQAPPRSKSAEPEPRFQEPAAEITVEEGSEKTDTSNLMEEK